MKVYIASDHAGFALKQELIAFLRDKHFELYDCGPEEFVHDDDYPDYISVAAQAVSESPEETRAIILGFSGQGEAMVANRFPHVRAAVFYGGSKHIITLSRQHNDANILSLGAHFVGSQDAKDVVMLWLSTPFSGESRHVRRINKIEQYD